MAVVIAPVVRVAPVARVVNVQVVVRPADRERGGHAPEVTGTKAVADRVRVVVHRVGIRVIVVNAARLVDKDLGRLVVGHIDDFLVDRHDLEHALIVIADFLVVVGLQVAGRIGAIAETLDGGDDVVLLAEHSFAETPGPVDLFVHHADDVRIIEQGNDRVVPRLVGFQRTVGFQLFQESRGLDDLQRIGRCRQHDGEQIIGIKGYRTDEFLQFGSIE